MKGKDDDNDASATSELSSASAGKTSIAPEASSVSSFIQQERLCKELYLSMGVHPNDIADTSDDDVASILEQMSRLNPNSQETAATSDRNIEDILREAESIIDEQRPDLSTQAIARSSSSRSESEASKRFQETGISNVDLDGVNLFLSSGQSSSNQRLLNVTQTIHSPELDLGEDRKLTCSYGEGVPQTWLKNTQRHETIIPSHVVGTPLEDAYKCIYEQIRKEIVSTLKPHLTGDFPDLKLSLPIPGLDTPAFDVPGCFNLEQEFLEERKRCLKLKADLDWLKRQHEREVAELRHHHEGQLNQVREELRVTNNLEPSIQVLQNEVRSKEQLISKYRQENENMSAELKDIKRLLLKLMALLKADNDNVCVFS